MWGVARYCCIPHWGGAILSGMPDTEEPTTIFNLGAFERLTPGRVPHPGCTCSPKPYDVFGHVDPGHIGFLHFAACPVTKLAVANVLLEAARDLAWDEWSDRAADAERQRAADERRDDG